MNPTPRRATPADVSGLRKNSHLEDPTGSGRRPPVLWFVRATVFGRRSARVDAAQIVFALEWRPKLERLKAPVSVDGRPPTSRICLTAVFANSRFDPPEAA